MAASIFLVVHISIAISLGFFVTMTLPDKSCIAINIERLTRKGGGQEVHNTAGIGRPIGLQITNLSSSQQN